MLNPNINFSMGVALLVFLMNFSHSVLKAQTITQTIRGSVREATTEESIPGATVIVLGSDSILGTRTDENGNFELENVPIGRQSVQVSFIGYQTYIEEELQIISGKETILSISLNRILRTLGEARVVASTSKTASLNSMATLSARQFTVEETERYAGGLDDPARLASSFAGVATPAVSSNGLSIRGNNPHGLLWRVDGVEVPNPNHFANLTVAGGGALSAISSQMMTNSDFLTGAFPAEYGNASSGVFDIQMKQGSSSNREYTFKAGVLGVDFATEGPFVKDRGATYAMNYRYSTLGLIAPTLPEDAGIIKYQDLAFKVKLPTNKLGEFSIWGFGGIDGVTMKPLDSADWTADFDRQDAEDRLSFFATAISQKVNLGNKSYLENTLSASGTGLDHDEEIMDDNLQLRPYSNIENNSSKITIQSILNHRFSNKHINRTGVYFNLLDYNFNMNKAFAIGSSPQKIITANGKSNHLQLFTQSRVLLTEKWIMNLGLHYQHLFLNGNSSFEPRAGIKYLIDEKQSIAMAYGIHSRLEILPIYFVEKNDSMVNKDLEFMKSSHFILSYNIRLAENLRFMIEPYYQLLQDVPVSPTSYLSSLNIENNIFFDEALVSEGTGRNYGVDITIEKFLSKGLYYLVTASLFDSKYTGIDGVERNTRFNKNYVFNFLAGKEWSVGKKRNNTIGANFRFNYLGGNRAEPLDVPASLAAKEVIYQETAGNIAYSKQFNALPVGSFTASYIRNKPKRTSTWSLQVLNITGTKEFVTDFYNLQTKTMDQKYDGIMIPNLSYKLEF